MRVCKTDVCVSDTSMRVADTGWGVSGTDEGVSDTKGLGGMRSTYACRCPGLRAAGPVRKHRRVVPRPVGEHLLDQRERE